MRRISVFLAAGLALTLFPLVNPPSANAVTGTTPQTITLVNNSTTFHRGVQIDISTSSDSGLTVSLTTSTSDICSVSGLTVRTKKNGTCSLTATQAGDDTFAPADPVTLDINIDAVEPEAPADAIAVIGDQSITVQIQPSPSDGGSAILYYEVTETRGNTTCQADPSVLPLSCTIGNLVNGRKYSLNVRAVNAIGASSVAKPHLVKRVVTGMVGYISCAISVTDELFCWGVDPNAEALTAMPKNLGAVKDVAISGESRVCAVLLNGDVRCWGAIGSYVYNGSPSQMPTNIKLISGGWYHMCAVSTSDEISCWGYGGDGQLNAPTGLSNITQLVSNERGSCVVYGMGQVACWGATHAVPEDLPLVKDIAIDPTTSCAVLLSGSLDCWGDDYGGLVTYVPSTNEPYSTIALSHYAACAIAESGAVDCWGANYWDRNNIPQGVVPASQIEMSWDGANCAVSVDQQLRCWGEMSGQRNIPPTQVVGTPGRVPAPPRVGARAIAGGVKVTWQPSTDDGGYAITSYSVVVTPNDATCPDVAAVADQTLYSCVVTGLTDGQSYDFQVIAHNEIGDSEPSVATEPGISVNPTTIETNYGCSLLGDHTVRCFGDNGNNRATPPVGLANVESISVQTDHSCALKTNGSVECWGYNGDGRYNKPDDFPALKMLDGNRYVNCGLTLNDQVACFGSGLDGVFAIPAGVSDSISLSVGDNEICNVNNQGELTCWGFDNFDIQRIPTDLGPVLSVSVGVTHVCAILINHKVRCWGGWGGQPPAGLTDVVKIRSGYNGTCAIKSSGSMVCFGDDWWNRFGGPNVSVESFSDAVVGYNGVCASLVNHGGVRCWGLVDGSHVPNWQDAFYGSSVIAASSPSAPTNVTVERIDGGLRVNFGPSAHSGGIPIIKYTASTTVGDNSCSVDADAVELTCEITGLTNGRAYAINAYAVNAVGKSKSSTALQVLEVSGRRGLAYCALLLDRSVKCWAWESNRPVANPPSDLGPVRSLALNRELSACAVLMTGNVRCWGEGWGLNPPNTLTNAESIAAGSYHFCVVTTTHTVECWGYADYGQLEPPVDLPPVAKVIAGDVSTCAITVEHALICWGGIDSLPEDLGPVLDAGIEWDHGCAIRTDHTVRCWGNNNAGIVSSAPTNLTNLESIDLVDWTACAIADTGALTCWGNNDWDKAHVPDDLAGAKDTAIGYEAQNCIVTTDDTLACLGYKWDDRAAYPTSLIARPGRAPASPDSVIVSKAPRGIRVTWQAPRDDGGAAIETYKATAAPGGKSCQTHVGADGNPLTCTIVGLDKATEYRVSVSAANEIGSSPVEVAYLAPVQVSAQGASTCAVAGSGTVKCWGWAEGPITPAPSNLGSALQVETGFEFACALLVDTTVSCWGDNTYQQTNVPAGLSGVKEITSGGYHTCAIKSDDTVVCWGFNGDNWGWGGQATVPDGLGNVAHITSDERGVCALSYTGVPTCWGQVKAIPDDLGTVTSINMSYWNGCAVLTTGTVRCWGDDAWYGISDTPTEMEVKAFDNGNGTNCAINMNDDLECWGRWDWGKKDIPSTLGKVSSVDVGHEHVCAITLTQSVVCWGNTANGRADVAQDLTSRSITTQLAPVRPEITSSSMIGDHFDISWAESIDDGGAQITSYTAVLNPGGYTCTIDVPTSDPLECTFTDLDTSITYDADVYATNEIGDSPMVTFNKPSNTQLAFPTSSVSAQANDGTLVDFVSTTESVCTVGAATLSNSGATTVSINNVSKGICALEASIDGSLVKTQSFKIAKAHRQRGLNVKVLDFQDGNINWSEAGRSICYAGTTDQINTWDFARPYSDSCSPENYMIHWSGGITWPGTYDGVTTTSVTFRTWTDDGAQLSINSTPIITDYNYHGMEGPTSAPVTLLAGQSYTIDMWMFQGGGGAGAILYWDNGTGTYPDVVVPTSAFGFANDLPKADQELTWNAESAALSNLRIGHPFVLGAQSDAPNPTITYSIASDEGCFLTGDNLDTVVMTNAVDPCEISAVGAENDDALASEPITLTLHGVEGGTATVTSTDLHGVTVHYQGEVLSDGDYAPGINDHFVSGETDGLSFGSDSVDIYCVPQDPSLTSYLIASDVAIESDGTFYTNIGTFGQTFGATSGCKVAAALHGDHPLDTWDSLTVDPVYPINVNMSTDGWGTTGFNVQVWGTGGYSQFAADYDCPACSILTANELGSFAQPNQGNPFSWDNSTGQVWSYAGTHNPMPYETDFVNSGLADGDPNKNYMDLTVDGEHVYTVPMVLDYGYDISDRISVNIGLNQRDQLEVVEETDLYRCENDGANIDDNCGSVISANVHLTRTTTIETDGVTYEISDVYSSLDDSDHSIVSGYEFRNHKNSSRSYQLASGVAEASDAYADLTPGSMFVGNEDALVVRTKYAEGSADADNSVAGYLSMYPSPTRLVASSVESDFNADAANGFAASFQAIQITPDVSAEIRMAMTQYLTSDQASSRETRVDNFVANELPLTAQTLTTNNPLEVNLSDGSGEFNVTSSAGLLVSIADVTPDVCASTGSYQEYGITFFGVEYYTAGDCEFTASQAGNDEIAPADDVSIAFTIVDDTDNGGGDNGDGGGDGGGGDETAVTLSEDALLQLPERELSESILLPGAELEIQASGFDADENVQLLVASTPVLLGNAHSDLSGAVTLTGTLPDDLTSGVHHLAVYAPGSGIGFQQEITVSSGSSPEPTEDPSASATPTPTATSDSGSASSGGSSKSGSTTTTTSVVSESPSVSPSASESASPEATQVEAALTDGDSSGGHGYLYLIILLTLVSLAIGASVVATKRK